MKAFGALSMAATASKTIDTKTKELMALAIGIAVHCDGCVAFHTKMAHQHGASRDEVAETVALADGCNLRLGSACQRQRPSRSLSSKSEGADSVEQVHQ